MARRKFAKNVSIAISIFDGRDEKKKHKLEKVRQKERQQEASLLAAAIVQGM